MMPTASKSVRCAIYTRVSTDFGLDQDFNSLDAQYDAAQAYIRSQAHAAGPSSARDMTTAAFPAAQPTAPPCSSFLLTLKPTGSMS
jgi:hypothetical protein